jgi:hypothetical protein
MRYAEWATTESRVEQTRQNTLRIVKAVVNYLSTASQAKLRQCISYIVAKRRRQGFGHEVGRCRLTLSKPGLKARLVSSVGN